MKELKEEEELTEVTKDLIERTNVIKENVKKSMIVGEVNILKGIIIFEVVLKKVNPSIINDNVVSEISNYIALYLRQKEEKEEKVNNYIHHGVNQCLTMLDLYNKSIKRKEYEK